MTSPPRRVTRRRLHEAPARSCGVVLCRWIAPGRGIPAAAGCPFHRGFRAARVRARLVACAISVALAVVGPHCLDEPGPPHGDRFTL